MPNPLKLKTEHAADKLKYPHRIGTLEEIKGDRERESAGRVQWTADRVMGYHVCEADAQELADAINAALTAERNKSARLLTRVMRQTEEIQQLRERLAAEQALSRGRMQQIERHQQELIDQQTQLAAEQAAIKAARELIQCEVTKDFFFEHGRRFVPAMLNILEGDTAALDAHIAAARQPLVELADSMLAALKTVPINYVTPQLCEGDIKRWEIKLAKVKKGKA